MFTPKDIRRTDRVDDDLPYTGVLVLSATAAAQDPRHLDAVTVTAGMAGPSSLTGPAQRTVHRLIGSDTPRGWRHQTHDEPLLNLAYEHRWRAHAFAHGSGDVLANAGVQAGNLVSMTTVGIGLRWGRNVPPDHFVPPPFFGEDTIGALPWRRSAQPSLFLAVHVDAGWFANAIHLDGNTFRDSQAVEHEDWIARAHVGVHYRRDRLAIAATLVQSSVPWQRPDDDRWEQYGRLSFGWDL